MAIEKYIASIPEGFLEFAEQIQQNTPVPLHFVSEVGCALTSDFKQDSSDINSLIVVQEKI